MRLWSFFRQVIATAVPLIILACGTTRNTTISTPYQAPTTPETPNSSEELPSSSSAREIPAKANYGDLVEVAKKLSPTEANMSQAGCLLEATAQRSWMLQADIHGAVNPLPEQSRLVGRLRSSAKKAVVLTPWGMSGDPDADLALVTFSSTPRPPATGSTTVFITADGAHLRRTDRALNEGERGPFRLPSIGAAVAAISKDKRETLVVTADPFVSVSRVAEYLTALQRKGFRVLTLAALLDAGTKLPSPPPVAGSATETAASKEDTTLCAEGLPAVSKTASGGAKKDSNDEKADGDDATSLPAAVLQSLEPFREKAAACIGDHASDVAFGGKMYLLMRVQKDGTLEKACFSKDEAKSKALRRCLLSALNTGVTFPKLEDKAGADFALPLNVPQNPLLVQKPICNLPLTIADDSDE